MQIQQELSNPHHPETCPQIIQVLDIENNCFGAYRNGKFIFDNYLEAIKDCNISWKHSSIMDEHGMIYLSLFTLGKKLSDYSDDPASMKAVEDMVLAQKKAALTAKVDLSEMCFFDVLPDHLMHQMFSMRERSMKNILSKIEKPKNYDILHKIHVLISNISKQPLSSGERIVYDMFSSATGRLTTTRGSFPILSISKESRSSILPKNDMFLELDLNGAEVRTLLSLCGQSQPDYDIHEFNKMAAANSSSTRQEIKAAFFAWLYNPEARDYNLEKFYSKDIYKKYYKNGYIETPFGRKLEVEERKALNYLTQSTTSDIVLENAYKIMRFLKGKKSFVSFTMHDSVVLDFCKEDHDLVKEIKNIFETNMFGKFLSSVSIGKNYCNLKEIKF